jgi:sugar/nucleoside kinase (ribokinase family)
MKGPSLPDTAFDVLAIGSAIVDVFAPADDSFLAEEGLVKGSMRLIDTAEATRLYGRMAAGREVSGGSAANTAAGIAALGGRAGFVGLVADDQLGEVYAHDIRAAGVVYSVPPRGAEPPTARCLILVTPDAQRTMNTYLGASQELAETDIDLATVAAAKILYLEGYLWDPAEPRRAMRAAIAASRAAEREIALTLSDSFCVERHRDDFRRMIAGREIDLLFANEQEILSLAQTEDLDAAIAAVAPQVPLLVVTRSERGALAVTDGTRTEVPASPVTQLVDTTGAGDLFAAGFLAGRAAGRGVETSLRMGAIAAAEIISHYGARPEADLRELVRGLA